MDKATALLHANRGARGDIESLMTALRAALLGDGTATYAGNPNGNVTPANRGEWLLDTNSLIFYRNLDGTNTGWAPDARNSTSSVELFDEFLGDVVADQWDTKIGTNSTTAVVDITIGLNGLLRISTGDGGGGGTTTLAANGVQLQSRLQWQANKTGLSLEVSIKPSTITANTGIFVGFTNQVTSLQMPLDFVDADGTLTNAAADALGFIFNGVSTTTVNTLWGVAGVKGSTKTAAYMTALQPTNGTIDILRIEVSVAGAASFYRNNTLLTTIPNAVTVTVPLTPVIVMRSRTTSSKSADIDYIRVRQNR